MHDPSKPLQLRYTPNRDRAFSCNRFWRDKYEVGQANGMGVGDRPAYVAVDSVAPDHYGDVSKMVGKVKKNYIRPGMVIQHKYPSIEEKYRQFRVESGPGAGKYDTRIPTGSDQPKAVMQGRPLMTGDELYRLGLPGAGEYDTRVAPGTNSKIKHGTLYDIIQKGRLPNMEIHDCSPGPAKYQCPGELDKIPLLAKIKNVKVPASMTPEEAAEVRRQKRLLKVRKVEEARLKHQEALGRLLEIGTPSPTRSPMRAGESLLEESNSLPTLLRSPTVTGSSFKDSKSGFFANGLGAIEDSPMGGSPDASPMKLGSSFSSPSLLGKLNKTF